MGPGSLPIRFDPLTKHQRDLSMSLIRLLRASALLAILTLAADTARAGLIIRASQDNSIQRSSSIPLDGVSYSDYVGVFGDFNIGNIQVSSNSGTAGLMAILTVNVEVEALSGGHTLQIDVTDDHFTFPAGGNYTLSNWADNTNPPIPRSTHTQASRHSVRRHSRRLFRHHRSHTTWAMGTTDRRRPRPTSPRPCR